MKKKEQFPIEEDATAEQFEARQNDFMAKLDGVQMLLNINKTAIAQLNRYETLNAKVQTVLGMSVTDFARMAMAYHLRTGNLNMEMAAWSQTINLETIRAMMGKTCQCIKDNDQYKNRWCKIDEKGEIHKTEIRYCPECGRLLESEKGE